MGWNTSEICGHLYDTIPLGMPSTGPAPVPGDKPTAKDNTRWCREQASRGSASPSKNYQRQILPKKNYPKIKVVFVIVVLPHFLGSKVWIILFHYRPLFLERSMVHVVPTVVVDVYRARPGLSAPRHNCARQHSIAGAI